MKPHPNQTDNVPLSDEGIIALYWARDERAIEETDRKYKKYLFSIAYRITHEKLDCEECLNDTYLAAWNAIPPTRPTALKAFLTVITRRISVRRYHRNQQKHVIPSDMTVSLSELEDFLSDGEDVDADFNAKLPVPPHTDPEGKTLRALYLYAWYAKVDGTLYGVIKTSWRYTGSSESNGYEDIEYHDGTYILYDMSTSSARNVSREELVALLGWRHVDNYSYGVGYEMPLC